MERNAQAVLKKALTLPEEDRAEVAGALLNSLEPLEEADIESAWRQEVAARVAALDAGEVETIPWGEVRDRLVARLSAYRPGEYFPEASRELEDALEWYLERSLQAAESFVRETERAVTVIAGAAGVWPLFEAGTRRYILHRFPYNIIYRETEGSIEVVAVARQKRRPRYWYRRLRR